jgi:hypothetical protein
VLDGTSSAPATFTVTNHSATTISPAIASLVGSQFAKRSDTCTGATLVAGATCSVAVAFTPTGVGPTSASLSASSATGVTTNAAVSGTALPFAIVPPSVDYGIVPAGSSSQATFAVTNVSSTELPLPFAASGVTGNGFSITADGCNGTTLDASASCAVVVTFAPTARGTTYHGQLTVTLFFGITNQATLLGTSG